MQTMLVTVLLLLSTALGDNISFNRGMNNARKHSNRMYHSQLGEEAWQVFPRVTVRCANNCDEEVMNYLARFMAVKVEEQNDVENACRRYSYLNYLGST